MRDGQRRGLDLQRLQSSFTHEDNDEDEEYLSAQDRIYPENRAEYPGPSEQAAAALNVSRQAPAKSGMCVS